MDSDLGTDPDDAKSVVILGWGQYAGRTNLLCAGISTTYSDSAGAMQSLLAFCGITGKPIGVPKTAFTPTGAHAYQANMRARGIALGLITGNETYSDAVVVYRTALAAATNLVDFICLGYMNNLMELLQSPADGISPLTGLQLVAQKVRMLWVMGGQYPSGTEYNFSSFPEAIAAASYVIANWPTPRTYSGFEVGSTVVSGQSVKGLQNIDLLAQALVDTGYSNGRESWDDLTTLTAVLGDSTPGFTSVYGSNAVSASTGANVFTADPNGRDRYLVKVSSDAAFASMLNARLLMARWALL